MLCDCGTCSFEIQIYNRYKEFSKNKRKAGIVIYNQPTNSLLLVQSRGNLWGFPKGSIEENETIKEAAIREVKEETGFSIDASKLSTVHKVNNKVTYYETVMERLPLVVQNIPDNDVNALAWVKLSCILDLINNKKIQLNSHAKFLCKKIFKIDTYTK